MRSHWVTGFVLGGIAAMALTAHAQSNPQGDPKPTVPAVAFCTAPRPQMCTDLYQPVCGFDRDGKAHTFGNSCAACAHEDVIRYTQGECRK